MREVFPHMNRFGTVIAPFAYQPTRNGLRGGFGSLGTGYNPPVGQGAGSGAETGASQGAAIGSTFGPIGTAIGAVAGAIGGAIAGSINKKDPEQYNFDAAVALWQQNRGAVLNIGNKYLVLAGLFDLNLKNPHIPIYEKYGHMGEQKFVTDFANVIYQAAENGQITASDTPASIMTRIVQPWIDSWGYGPMVDPHADLINLILQGMVADYVFGQQTNWTARSGDYPFGNIPPFPIQKVLGGATSSSPAPAPATPPTAIAPVGTPAAPTPQQLVATPPAMGSAVQYAPDMSQQGAAVALPAGFIYQGLDPYNSSWVLQQTSTGTPYVLWQGNLVPYTSSMFAPSAPASSSTVATTSSGTAVTSSQIQALVNQLAAQGASAQQAYTSALQTLQNSGVSSTPAVQSAVQSAVQAAPATTPTASTAGIGWLVGLGIVGSLFLAGKPKSGRRRRAHA